MGKKTFITDHLGPMLIEIKIDSTIILCWFAFSMIVQQGSTPAL